MIFVDTSAWFAGYVPWDANAGKARAWVADNTQKLVTTDYVIDELLTLLRSRGEDRAAVEAGNDL